MFALYGLYLTGNDILYMRADFAWLVHLYL